MQYNTKILDHFYHPRHAGPFDDMTGVLLGSAGSRERGDELVIALKREGGSILEARFQAFGGVATIACGSYLAEWLQGKTIADAKSFNSQQLMAALDLPTTKRHAALLAEDALRQALYQA